MVSPQITNLGIIVMMMQLSKKIPFEDPDVLLVIRIMFVLSNVIIGGIYFYTQLKINKKKDMTVLKYVEPAPMGSGEEPKPVTTTVHDYDKQQMRQLFRGQLMSVGMMCVMHLYFKYSNPLLVQSVIPIKNAVESNLVKIHLFGKPATGELQRPFKNSGIAGQGEVRSDKASIESAEKKWRGGYKEE